MDIPEGLTVEAQQGLWGLPDAFQIRVEVFEEEQGFLEEFDDKEETSAHVVVYQGQQALATCRLYPVTDETFTTWTIGRIAVRKAYRGLHVGQWMLSMVEAALRESGVQKVKLSSQMQAKGFYEKLGYTSLGDAYYEQHCLHVDMEKYL